MSGGSYTVFHWLHSPPQIGELQIVGVGFDKNTTNTTIDYGH